MGRALAHRAGPDQDIEDERLIGEAMIKPGIVIGRFLAAVGFCALAAMAAAGQIAYEAVRFDAALVQRESFVVALVTDWCTTCSRQEAVVAELLDEPRFEGLTLFVADFDREAALKQRLRVVAQGTFVVFKDGTEVARSTGQTDKATIAALFARAL